MVPTDTAYAILLLVVSVWELGEEKAGLRSETPKASREEKGRGVPFPSRLGSWGSVVTCKLPAGSGAENKFWCILSFTNSCIDKKM